MCMSSRGSQQDLREGSPDRSTLGRKQRFVFNCLIVLSIFYDYIFDASHYHFLWGFLREFL